LILWLIAGQDNSCCLRSSSRFDLSRGSAVDEIEFLVGTPESIRRSEQKTLLDLISTGFACRSCSVLAEMAFSWPSTSPSQPGNTTPLAEAIRGQVRAFTADEC
jgi:hypothetical protein